MNSILIREREREYDYLITKYLRIDKIYTCNNGTYR